MFGFGIILMIVGAIAFWFGLTGSTAAPGSTVVNLGLLTGNLGTLVFGSGLFVAGAALCAGAAVTEALWRIRKDLKEAGLIAKPAPPSAEPAKPKPGLLRRLMAP